MKNESRAEFGIPVQGTDQQLKIGCNPISVRGLQDDVPDVNKWITSIDLLLHLAKCIKKYKSEKKLIQILLISPTKKLI